ncbi:serine hydrolase domain-containing protein [Actinopolymorpha pittospori]|uniref:CubicO group peptidase (Beta-lactamase class C family) n=1 Tax=Actinopolymorpha pittospori TaxID=648752 RepID=A0A927MY79_9ACTN|nr:serine hydrolase domain-containing protein [Actinopolymorpha pittospori]MBE1605365.1 CubicO group peptidase (beta-lactamase class C family) [Actinopolymorpha pittospori]
MAQPLDSSATTQVPTPGVDTRGVDTATGRHTVLPATADALLRRIAKEQATSRVPAVTAGVVRDGALAWSGGRGRVGDARPDANTQSRLGSISKTFTAVLVARLRDEGRLDFADPLDRHVPGTPLGDRTLAQLLSHLSGAQAESDGQWWERTPGAGWDGLAATFNAETARHRAGRRFHYSNLGFAVLGEVVARLRGRSWWEVLRAEVLEPLEMRRTTYHPEAPHASGFAVHPWADVVLPEPTHDAGAMAPAGQLWSTITDQARWAAFVAGDTGGVLDPDTLAEMREPNAVERAPQWTAGYGLGWQVLRAGRRTLVGHGGSMPGFLAGLYVDVEEKVGAVCLANTTSGMGPFTLGADLIDILLDREPSPAPEWTPASALPEGTLDLVGPWYWGPSPSVMRARQDGLLELTPFGNGGRASRFRPNGDGTWTGLDGYYAGETLRAERGPSGEVTHLNLATFIYTREPYDDAAPIPGGVDTAGWTGTSESRPRGAH